jgi:hypothetical protein
MSADETALLATHLDFLTNTGTFTVKKIEVFKIQAKQPFRRIARNVRQAVWFKRSAETQANAA